MKDQTNNKNHNNNRDRRVTPGFLSNVEARASSKTSQDYASLLGNHSQLLLNHNSMSVDYASLTAIHNHSSARDDG